MAKINLTDEILKYDDAEIIEFLFETVKGIRLAYHGAMEQNDPSLIYTTYTDVDIVMNVLRKLNRRNEEKAVQ